MELFSSHLRRYWNEVLSLIGFLHNSWNVIILITQAVTIFYFLRNKIGQWLGVPAVAQWVKKLTAATGVSVEAWVQSLAHHSGLKDLALPGFISWPRNFHTPWVWPFKKGGKKRKTERPVINWETKPNSVLGSTVIRISK